MADKTTKGTTKKTVSTTRTTTKSKAATQPKAAPKKAKAPKEDLVVFAFRLTEAERAAIHKTAGPRNATQFVRRVAVAFAAEDAKAFDAVVKEARDATKA